eukprot:scaffold24918_cov131-Isochrysis_galbana.AAC.2
MPGGATASEGGAVTPSRVSSGGSQATLRGTVPGSMFVVIIRRRVTHPNSTSPTSNAGSGSRDWHLRCQRQNGAARQRIQSTVQTGHSHSLPRPAASIENDGPILSVVSIVGRCRAPPAAAGCAGSSVRARGPVEPTQLRG